jgi:hypothetical protein
VDQAIVALWTFALIHAKNRLDLEEIKHASKTGSAEGITGGLSGHAWAGDVCSQAIEAGTRPD